MNGMLNILKLAKQQNKQTDQQIEQRDKNIYNEWQLQVIIFHVNLVNPF